MRISRITAFEAQGVTLTYPERSWSGIRGFGELVVMAIRENDVQVHAGGFSCLLWAPVIEGATEWVDRPMKQERLEHCRLALLGGRAGGLLVYSASGEVERDAMLALRVEMRHDQFWATWGSTASVRRLPVPAISYARPLPRSFRESARIAA